MPRLQARSHSQTFLPVHHERGTRLRTTSSANLPIGGERTPQIKKIPLKTMSFQLNRGRSLGGPNGGSILPDHYNESRSNPLQHTPLHQRKLKDSFRASEKGKGDILPTIENPRGGYTSDWASRRTQSEGGPLSENIKSITQKLRSRRRTATVDTAYHNLDVSSSHYGNTWLSDSCRVKHHRKARFSLLQMKNMRKREWLQILVISVVTFLVLDSYNKAVATTDRLKQFKDEESMMMLHLQRIEQQSIHLHENMSRLADVSSSIANQKEGKTATPPEAVDSNLIRVQTQQLYQMEEELDHELRALQSKLQHVARSAIINTFGEGPVQVVIELDFPNSAPSDHNTISMLLWYDTPHAAWTWLQQIRKGEWNGAPFSPGKSFTIDAAPMVTNAGTLDFVEKSSKNHEAWTVGLTDKSGSLGMFINLQDNGNTHTRDVCVGKVIDGFDALQRLVDVSRRSTGRKVSIKQATATHLTRNQRPV